MERLSSIYFVITIAICISKTSTVKYPKNSGCYSEFDYAECVIRARCNTNIDTNLYDYYNTNCTNKISNYRFGLNPCYPLYVTYHHNEVLQNSEIPSLGDSRYIYCIYMLDLSDNIYEFAPTLIAMPNVATLVLSRNALTAAKLSNKYSLPELRDIDLSYNNIETIEMMDGEIVFEKLEMLNISFNHLKQIPDAIFETFSDLVILDLSYNFINHIDILTFEGLKKLKCLYIQHNRIVDINSSLLRFNELEELDLSHNKIKNLNEVDFKKLFKLKKLDVSYNLLLSMDINIFTKMASLNILNLNNNTLQSIDKYAFMNVTNLESIDLSRNKLKVLPIDLFKNKSIQYFFIKGNNLSGPLLRGMFEGLNLITELDISNQEIISIEDYAFYGLNKLEELLLNNNKIKSLANKCFRMLHNLNNLDLSNNKITSINFDKQDLVNLQFLSLNNNYLFKIQYEHFRELTVLQFLDVSNNNISQLETNSFISQIKLIYFKISNNSLSGTLEGNTFKGLTSLPYLDISCSMLNIIKNSSFNGMFQLKHLNLSHSKIHDIEFNSFSQTGNLDVIDLSYNYLEYFNVNTTEFMNVRILFLNNNLLKVISVDPNQGLPRLSNITLSYNRIRTINNEMFYSMNTIRRLDLSFNPNIKFDVSIINKMQNLNTILLSGIPYHVNFTNVIESRLLELQMSYSGICNVTRLNLNQLEQLEILTLNNNDISKLNTGAFSNVTLLKKLDLSYNKINFIQPGVFKYNTLLEFLNISHNVLTSINYGIFRGLISLHTIDMSYNNVNSLQNERFYEVSNLSVLIADHNQIDHIGTEEFVDTKLTLLSIGDNPLPCEVLVNFKRKKLPFVITAVRLDESNDENVDGVTCNKRIYNSMSKVTFGKLDDTERFLVNIRDILLNISKNEVRMEMENNDLKDTDSIEQLKKLANDNQEEILQLTNVMFKTINNLNNTNVLLEKLLKLLTINISSTLSHPFISNNNATSENLILYIDSIKKDLKSNIIVEKQNIVNELKTLIAHFNSTNISNDKLHSNDNVSVSHSTPSSGIIETCVVLILIIVGCVILYKFYKSRTLLLNRQLVSTRETQESIETSNL